MALRIEEKDFSVKNYPVRLRSRGQITVPQRIREQMNVEDGDMLTLVQVGEVAVLVPFQPQIPQLADRIVAKMAESNVTLADLLTGLEIERYGHPLDEEIPNGS